MKVQLSTENFSFAFEFSILQYVLALGVIAQIVWHLVG